jgi:hypothetical protein
MVGRYLDGAGSPGPFISFPLAHEGGIVVMKVGAELDDCSDWRKMHLI